MVRKPWPIIILTLLFICIPIGNIVTSYIVSPYDISFGDFLYSLFAFKSNRIAVFELIIPSLIAAFATFAVKRWSYMVLALFVLYVFVSGSYDLYTHFGNLSFVQVLFIFLIPTLFSLAVTLYFLIPTVKTTYFDPKVRWWEAKPRYKVNLETNYTQEHSVNEATITNISQGGAFLESNSEIKMDKNLNLVFTCSKFNFNLDAKVVFQRGEENQYGIQFIENQKKELKKLKKAIHLVKVSGAELCRPTPLWNEDLKKWLKSVLTTGKGITPSIPQKYQAKDETK